MSALPQQALRPHGAPAPRDATRGASPPTLRLVERRRRAHWVGLMLALVVVGVLAVVALQAQSAGAAFEARTLEQEVVDLRRRHEQLVAEVSSLQSPERLRRIAVEDLGMVPATERVYLDLSTPGRLVGIPPEERVADPVKRIGAHQ